MKNFWIETVHQPSQYLHSHSILRLYQANGIWAKTVEQVREGKHIEHQAFKIANQAINPDHVIFRILTYNAPILTQEMIQRWCETEPKNVTNK